MDRSPWRSLLKALLAAGLILVVLPAVPAGATSQPPGGRVSGMDLQSLGLPGTLRNADFQRIRADGVNTVSFDVFWVAYERTSKVVPVLSAPPNAKWAPPTDSDADLLTAAREAEQAGLKVMLTPKVMMVRPDGLQEWRGLYNPSDPATFFSTYQSMVDHYATLAKQAGVSTFLVGSEMPGSDQYLSYWRQIIASARQRFGGPIGYEVDWREIPKFQFGDALDVLFLSAYLPISNDENPTLAQLEAGWHSYHYPGQTDTKDAFSEIAGFARRFNKPIIFGETGYMSTTYAAQEPWWNRPDPPDPQLQYTAYKALLDTFVGQPWWGGVLWWAWNDGPIRTPEGKPAESLIGADCVARPAPGGPDPCNLGLAHAARSPTSSARTVSAVALGAIVLAFTSLVILGRRLRWSRQRPSPLRV